MLTMYLSAVLRCRPIDLFWLGHILHWEVLLLSNQSCLSVWFKVFVLKAGFGLPAEINRKNVSVVDRKFTNTSFSGH